MTFSCLQLDASLVFCARLLDKHNLQSANGRNVAKCLQENPRLTSRALKMVKLQCPTSSPVDSNMEAQMVVDTYEKLCAVALPLAVWLSCMRIQKCLYRIYVILVPSCSIAVARFCPIRKNTIDSVHTHRLHLHYPTTPQLTSPNFPPRSATLHTYNPLNFVQS